MIIYVDRPVYTYGFADFYASWNVYKNGLFWKTIKKNIECTLNI